MDTHAHTRRHEYIHAYMLHPSVCVTILLFVSIPRSVFKLDIGVDYTQADIEGVVVQAG